LGIECRFGTHQSAIKGVQSGASAIGGQIEVLNASSSREMDSAFASLAQKRADALFGTPSTLFLTLRVQLTTLAAHRAIPAMYFAREFTEAWRLISYGTNFAEVFRQLGNYCGLILKGAKPADPPVLQSTKFEFVINLQTARALGIALLPGVLSIADEVIE
jgi:putative ABC transport system substrate-binding protein